MRDRKHGARFALGLTLGAVAALGLQACEDGGPRDIHSCARPEAVRVTHLDLEWQVLFEELVLDGSVVLHLERDPAARNEPLRLDTRDLEIRSIAAGRAGSGESGASGMTETEWRLGDSDPTLGSELLIELPDGADRVRIAYRTRPEASGLQWLAKEQTAQGRHPFLYSQSQAIHARSWIPCQDSPAVRVTFDATVHVRPPLRAVMAAEEVTGGSSPEGEWRTFRFTMPHPIPSYLIALAVGEIAFDEIGPRTGVWAEPSVLEKAVHEFADVERMMEVTEKAYGPYRWGRFDILVLPPAYPFGGMENPTLTFATPTVLAGDRSQVSLIAHELAHSWSGNYVTNATWADSWLNEGFTTYLEERIMEMVYGPERAAMEWMLARQDLDAEIEDLADKPGDQKLRIDLAGRDPDDGFSSVAYVKGALLLRLLEETYGRDLFDPFLRSWFDEHAFTSVSTDRFLSFLEERLLKVHQPLSGRAPPDLSAWIDQPGVPETAPRSESDVLARVDEAMRRWSSGEARAEQLETGGWTTQHWLYFLRTVPASLSRDQMAELDAAFDLTQTGNAEILDQWLVLAVRHEYTPAFDRLEQFLTTVGRIKFLRPLYKEMVKTAAGRDRARAIYAKARPLYHPQARRALDEIVAVWPAEGEAAGGS